MFDAQLIEQIIYCATLFFVELFILTIARGIFKWGLRIWIT